MRTAVLLLILSLSTIISKAQFSQEYQYARAEHWENSLMKISADINAGKTIKHPVTGEDLSKRLAESGAKAVSEIEYNILSRLLSEYNAQTRVNLDTAKLVNLFIKQEKNISTYLIWNMTDTIYSNSTYASLKNDYSNVFATKFKRKQLKMQIIC